MISIHALLAESDSFRVFYWLKVTISIHALLAESDVPEKSESLTTYLISIHALLAESDGLSYFYIIKITISIHALLAESDRKPTTTGDNKDNISIHALLAESDYLGAWKSCNVRDFYPRSPCGERRNKKIQNAGASLFLSTLSLRRATAKVHKTVGHFCAYETNFMEIASSC